MRSRGVIEEFLLDGVPVESGHGAQAAGDGGPGAAAGLQVAGEALDVGTASLNRPGFDAASFLEKDADHAQQVPRRTAAARDPDGS